MEGPLSPRWVKSMPSSKYIFWKETIASRDNPANFWHFFKNISWKVKGTRPGFCSITFILNCFAISYPKFVAPIFGIERPPEAITSESQT